MARPGSVLQYRPETDGVHSFACSSQHHCGMFHVIAHGCSAMWESIAALPQQSIAIPLGVHRVGASKVSCDRRAACLNIEQQL